MSNNFYWIIRDRVYVMLIDHAGIDILTPTARALTLSYSLNHLNDNVIRIGFHSNNAADQYRIFRFNHKIPMNRGLKIIGHDYGLDLKHKGYIFYGLIKSLGNDRYGLYFYMKRPDAVITEYKNSPLNIDKVGHMIALRLLNLERNLRNGEK